MRWNLANSGCSGDILINCGPLINVSSHDPHELHPIFTFSKSFQVDLKQKGVAGTEFVHI